MDSLIKKNIAAVLLCCCIISNALMAQALYWLDASYNAPLIGKATTSGTNVSTIALAASSLPEGICFLPTSKKIIWSELCYSGARLHRADTSVTTDSLALSNGSVIRGVAFDKDSNWVYYATSNLLASPEIDRIRPDGSGKQTMLTLNTSTGNPRALAIDPVTRKLYWTEFTQGAIMRMDLAVGATAQTIVSGLNGPVGLAVYHVGGWLYWAEANANTISRSDLNGGSVTPIVSGLSTPNYLALDTVNSIVYWTEISTPSIRKSSFNGSGVQTIPITVSHPTGLLVLSQQELLPVELTSFTVTISRESAILTWATATESNNYSFEIERRAFKISNWVKVGFVAGNGTSSKEHSYSYTDKNVSSGTYAYRLKQIDNNGTFKYSSEAEVTINVPTCYALGQNYPNPFNPTTTISYDIPAVGSQHVMTMKVYDIVGREVAILVNETKEAGSYKVTFKASKLASGVYFYRLQAGNYSSVKKLVLMK
jgi:Secretion system C-terminal sorting domain